MITVLKASPITFDERDYMEELVIDNIERDLSCCERCVYHDYVPGADIMATCSDIHGCNKWDDSFFRLTELINS